MAVSEGERVPGKEEEQELKINTVKLLGQIRPLESLSLQN